MNYVDVAVVLLLALGDICLIAHIRQRRARYLRMDRMSHCLVLHIRRELTPESLLAARRQIGRKS